MKRIVSFALAVVMCMSLFTACGTAENGQQGQSGGDTSKASGTEKKALTVWLKKEVTDSTNQQITDRVKEFGKNENINVTVEVVPYEKLYPMWTAAIQANTLPDVSFFQYQEAGQFYAQDLLLDVTDVNKNIEEKSGKVVKSVLDPVTFDSKQYAVPQKFYSVALHYRTDLLEAAGYKEPPKTWDEFREMAKAMTDPSKGVYGAGIGLGATNSDAEWLNQVMLWGLGGALIDKDSKTIIANSPKTVKALEYISSIYLNDKSTPPSAINWDDAGNNKAYLSGQAAMVINAGTLLAAIKTDNPDLYAKTGVAEIPSGPDGFYMPSAGSYLGIFKSTKYPEDAKKLIEYTYDSAWYDSWMKADMPAIVPIFEKAKDQPEWQEKLTKPFIDSLRGMCFIGYPGEYTPKAGEVFNLKLLNKTIENIVVGKLSPQKAADQLQAEIESTYKK